MQESVSQFLCELWELFHLLSLLFISLSYCLHGIEQSKTSLIQIWSIRLKTYLELCRPAHKTNGSLFSTSERSCVYLLGAVLYALFGTSERQPWSYLDGVPARDPSDNHRTNRHKQASHRQGCSRGYLLNSTNTYLPFIDTRHTYPATLIVP